jgi:aspartyl/asparaginyl-tRNA synthetase
MNQLIIIRTNKAEKIKAFLDQEKQNYKVFNETKRKKDLFANYQEAIKDKEREAEISLLDQAQEEDDEENKDWEWYDN